MKKQYALLVLPFALAACTKTAPVSTPATSSEPGSSALTSPQALQQKTLSVALKPQNNSGQSGTAMLEEKDGKVMVTLHLTGGKFTLPQPVHIHLGSCPTPGTIKFPLTSIVNGSSTSTIDTTIENLKAMQPLAVNVHKSASDANTYTACGNLSFGASTSIQQSSPVGTSNTSGTGGY